MWNTVYDRKVHGKPFSNGDMVWLFSPAVPREQSRKLHHPWKGPLIVVEKMGSNTYKIKGQNNRKFQIVHFDRLKPCVKSSALNVVNPIAPKCNRNSDQSQIPQAVVTPATTHCGDDDSDLPFSDDDE